MKKEIEELENYIDKKITLAYQFNGCGYIHGKYKGGFYKIIDDKKCFYIKILPYRCRKIRTYKLFSTKYFTITDNFIIYKDYQHLYGITNGGWGRTDENFYNFTHQDIFKNDILFENIKEKKEIK